MLTFAGRYQLNRFEDLSRGNCIIAPSFEVNLELVFMGLKPSDNALKLSVATAGRKSSDGENTIDLNLEEKASHRDW